MSLETLVARIKKDAYVCANCGGSEFTLITNDNKKEMYFLCCKKCPHKRLEIDYDQATENLKKSGIGG